MEEQVDTMDTYNSIDQKGMEYYLNNLQNRVFKSLFPSEKKRGSIAVTQHQYNKDINNQNDRRPDNNRRGSIDKISRLARAGGGADPLLGGRTNSSINRESESRMQHFPPTNNNDETNSSYTVQSKDSLRKIQVPDQK